MSNNFRFGQNRDKAYWKDRTVRVFFKTILGSFKIILGYFRPFKIILDHFKAFQGGSVFSERRPPSIDRLYTHCVPTFELTSYGEIGLFQNIDMCNSNKLHVWLIMWPTCKCIHGVAKSHQPIYFGLRSSFWNHVIVDKPVCGLEDVDTEDTK